MLHQNRHRQAAPILLIIDIVIGYEFCIEIEPKREQIPEFISFREVVFALWISNLFCSILITLFSNHLKYFLKSFLLSLLYWSKNQSAREMNESGSNSSDRKYSIGERLKYFSLFSFFHLPVWRRPAFPVLANFAISSWAIRSLVFSTMSKTDYDNFTMVVQWWNLQNSPWPSNGEISRFHHDGVMVKIQLKLKLSYSDVDDNRIYGTSWPYSQKDTVPILSIQCVLKRHRIAMWSHQ